jgi:amidase
VASPHRLSMPAGCEALLELASFGPIARSVEDLELALQIIREPGSPPLAAAKPVTPSEIRIAWTEDFGGTPLDDDSRQTIQRFADLLASKVRRVERCPNANIDYEEAWWTAGVCLGAINTLFQSSAVRWVRRLVSPVLLHIGPRHPLRRGLVAGTALRGDRVRAGLESRLRIIEQLEAFLDLYDTWICPAFPTPAFSHRGMSAPVDVDGRPMPQLEANLLHSIIFNLTGHPVVTMPIGFSAGGLPIGVQLVGKRWHEMSLLSIAKTISSAADGYRNPPGYE